MMLNKKHLTTIKDNAIALGVIVVIFLLTVSPAPDTFEISGEITAFQFGMTLILQLAFFIWITEMENEENEKVDKKTS